MGGTSLSANRTKPRLRVLMLPGLGDSGPAHWQSIWQANDGGFHRVEQRDWAKPDLAEWVAALDRAVVDAACPLVLVAHSLACALVAHWARGADTSAVKAAMLVSPSDVDSELHTPPEVRGFAPMPLSPLPFRTLVIASASDPYVAPIRVEQFARAWGARLVNVGDQGHINVTSGHGEWSEGRRHLSELLEEAAVTS